MQTFRPADIDLAARNKPARGFDGGAAQDGSPAPDAPVTRSMVAVDAPGGGLRSGVWDSTAGRKEFIFPVDEWAYILEGEAQVTVAGETHVLRAGDVLYAPAGVRMSWFVPTHVRKVWVHRRPPLPGRIRRKVRRILSQRLGIFGAVATEVLVAGALI